MKPSDQTIPVYRYDIQTATAGCGTSQIHCDYRADTRYFDKGGLYYLNELHARAGLLLDNYIFVFKDHLGHGVIVGDH